MGQQPLVAGSEVCIVPALDGHIRLVGVGSLGKSHQHLESVGGVGVAGGVVQGGGVDFQQSRDAIQACLPPGGRILFAPSRMRHT